MYVRREPYIYINMQNIAIIYQVIIKFKYGCNYSSQESSTFHDGDLDLVDSIASSFHIDEATKRCVLADKFHLTH